MNAEKLRQALIEQLTAAAATHEQVRRAASIVGVTDEEIALAEEHAAVLARVFLDAIQTLADERQAAAWDVIPLAWVERAAAYHRKRERALRWALRRLRFR